jgi:hypothetical protein
LGIDAQLSSTFSMRSPSRSPSQVSPLPSPSVSSWLKFDAPEQLSQLLPTPSPSTSIWSRFDANGPCRRRRRRPCTPASCRRPCTPPTPSSRTRSHSHSRHHRPAPWDGHTRGRGTRGWCRSPAARTRTTRAGTRRLSTASGHVSSATPVSGCSRGNAPSPENPSHVRPTRRSRWDDPPQPLAATGVQPTLRSKTRVELPPSGSPCSCVSACTRWVSPFTDCSICSSDSRST